MKLCTATAFCLGAFFSAAGSYAQVAPSLTPPDNGPRRVDAANPTVTLVDVVAHIKPGVVIEHATIVLRAGRIISVEPTNPTSQTPEVIDGKPASRLHVYPAFIDPYVEVTVARPDPQSPGAHWNTRVTPQRTALDGMTRANLEEGVAESLRKLGFGAACISPRGGIIRGTSAVVSLAKPGQTETSQDDPNLARPSVYRNGVYQTIGLSGGGFGGGGETAPAERQQPEDWKWAGYPGSLMGTIAVIRQCLSDADYLESTGQATSIASCLSLLSKGAQPLLFDADDELDQLRAIKIADEFGRRRMVLGSGFEFRRLPAVVAALNQNAQGQAHLILPVNFPELPKIASLADAESVDLSEMMNWEQAPTNPRRLAEAGFAFSFTTARLRDRGKFRENINTAIERGLEQDTAFAALTTQPAQLLGIEGDVGTLESGKRANLIVTDGALFTPKADPAPKILDLYIDGSRHEITAPKGVDLEGDWKVTLDPPPQTPGEVSYTFDSENRLTIKKVVAAPQQAAPPADGQPAPANAEPGAQPAPLEKPEGEPKPADADASTPPPAEVDPKSDNAREKPEDNVKKASAQNLRVMDHRISFTFEHEPFGSPGVFFVNGTIEHAAVPQRPLREKPQRMVGTATSPDGRILRWSAQRRPPAAKPGKEKDDAAEKEGEPKSGDDKPKDQMLEDKGPESLASIAIPFGAYGLPEYPGIKSVLIEHATIWTSGPGGVIQDGVLRLDDGKISFVGTSGDWSKYLENKRIGAPDVTIDASGKHVTPGLLDCHSHTGVSGGVNEGGQSVTAEVRIQDVTNPDAISWYRQLAAGITTVNNLHGSANVIGGQNCVNKNRWGCAAPDDMHFDGAISGIKFALGENPKGSNWGDDSVSRYPQTRMGVEATLRDRFTAAREYLATRGTVPRDLELEPLAEILEGKRLIHCHSYRQDEILMLCRVASDFGFKIGTFQHVLEGYKVADAIRDSVTPGGGGSCFSDWWAYKVEVQDAIPYAGAIMHDVGVNVSFNSDSDEMARRMNTEAAKAMKYGGLSAEEALRFVTINPARQLQIDSRVGSLEAGKDADVVLWSGDPLSTFSKCEGTWVDGRLLFSLEQDAAHRSRITAERQRLIQKIMKPSEKKGDAGEGGGNGGGGGGGGPAGGGRRRGPRPNEDDGGRRSLLAESLAFAADVRRERLLHMLRMGLDPAYARAGDCGCEDVQDAQNSLELGGER